jgi:hypothetical protein
MSTVAWFRLTLLPMKGTGGGGIGSLCFKGQEIQKKLGFKGQEVKKKLLGVENSQK